MKWRLAIFAAVTAVLLVILFSWPASEAWPQTNVIGSTSFGPLLLLLIPALLCWVSFGAERREGAFAGFGIALVLLAICLLLIRFARSVVEPGSAL